MSGEESCVEIMAGNRITAPLYRRWIAVYISFLDDGIMIQYFVLFFWP